MHGTRCLRCVLFGLVLLACVQLVGAEPTVIPLPAPASDFAVDDTNGTTAIVYSEQNKVVFYPKLWRGLDGAKEVTVGKAPVSVVFKRTHNGSLFVVVSKDDSRIFVIDATTLEPLKEATLSLSAVHQVRTSSNPADPYVYYCGGGGHDSRVAQFDTETMEDHGAVQIGGMGDSVASAFVSADGSALYTLGPWSPRGFQCYRIAPRSNPRDPTVASQVTYEHDSRGGYVPDRFSTSVAAGTKIYSPDLRETIIDLRENVVAFSPYDPAVITFGTTDLSVWSTNTYKLVKKLSLPAQKNTPGMIYDMRPEVFRGIPLWEPSRQFVMFCQREKVTVIPAAEFAVDEPTLAVEVSGSLQFTAGVASTLSLKPRAAGTTITIASGPKGIALKSDTLVWKPTADDVGTQQVVLSLKNGPVERKQQLSLMVSQTYIALPFAGNLMAATPDGKRALLCKTRSERFPQREAAESASEVAIVDLESGKILAQRQTPQPIAAVEIDGGFAYLALADSDAVFIWSAQDLSDVKRILVPERARRLKSIAGKLFVAGAQGGMTVLNVPGFEPAGGVFAAVPAAAGAGRAEMPIWMGDGWLWRGMKLDADLKGVLSLQTGGPLVNATPASGAAPRSTRTSGTPNRWSVVGNGQQIQRANGQVISQIPFQGGGTVATVVLDSVPAAVTALVRVQGGEPRNPGATRVNLEFRDLVTGQPCDSQTLMLEAVNLVNVPEDSMRASIIECMTAGKILVRFRDRLFVVPLSGSWVEKLDTPLVVSAKNGVPVLNNGDRTIEVSCMPAGAKVRYSLRHESPITSIDATTGSVTFNIASVQEQAAKAMATRFAAAGTSDEDALGSYRLAAARYFKEVTGRDAAGVPAAVPMEVIAQDAKLQQSSCTAVALVDIPLDNVMRELQANRASATPATAPHSGWPSCAAEHGKARLSAGAGGKAPSGQNRSVDRSFAKQAIGY